MAAQQGPPSGERTPGPAFERVFERKVRLSKWALLFEQLWPRAWLVLGLAGLFIGGSLAGPVAEAAGASPQDCSLAGGSAVGRR